MGDPREQMEAHGARANTKPGIGTTTPPFTKEVTYTFDTLDVVVLHDGEGKPTAIELRRRGSLHDEGVSVGISYTSLVAVMDDIRPRSIFEGSYPPGVR